VGGISRFPLALVVHPSFEAKTVKEFLDYARANPGKLNYASPGNGSPHHLAMEMFKNRTKTFLTHIPYRGAAPALQDVMGGQVPCMFLDLAAGLPVITSGKVRALAIGSAKRVAALPDVPTAAEAGLRDYQVVSWVGLFAPVGTPPAIVTRLHTEIARALASPAARQRFSAAGADVGTGSPQDFGVFLAAERAKWSTLIREANIKAE